MSSRLVLDENWLRELLGDELYLSMFPMGRVYWGTPESLMFMVVAGAAYAMGRDFVYQMRNEMKYGDVEATLLGWWQAFGGLFKATPVGQLWDSFVRFGVLTQKEIEQYEADLESSVEMMKGRGDVDVRGSMYDWLGS